MPIRDVLWACPACSLHAALGPGRRGTESCRACGVSFRRGRGAQIVARFPDGSVQAREAAAWMAALPQHVDAAPADGLPLATAAASVRRVSGFDPVRSRGEFLNQIERLGTPNDATIELYGDRLQFRFKHVENMSWPLLEVSALGSSSGSLQLRRRRELLMVRLQDASTRWWEERIRGALRAAYERAGRGEIVEFQPRIVTR